MAPSTGPAATLHDALAADYALHIAQDHKTCECYCHDHKEQISLLIIAAASQPDDGFDLCHRVHTAYPALPILLLIEVNPDHMERALDAGAKDCLTLPTHPRLLKRRVRNIIAQSRAINSPSLTRSFDYLRTAIDSVETAILIMHRSAPQPFLCNEPYIHMWGIPAAVLQESSIEVMSEFISRQLANPDHPWEILARIAQAPEQSHHQIVITRDQRVIEYFVHPQYFNGEHIGHVWTFSDITQQQLSEKRLQKWVELEALKNSISSTFTNLNIDEIDSGIEQGLQVVGEFFDVDRCHILLLNEPRVYFEWCAKGVKPRSGDWAEYPVHELTGWYDQARRLEPVQVESIDQIPVDALRERAIFADHNIQSMVIVPVSYKNRFWGVVGMDTTTHTRKWTKEEISLLSSMGDTFLHALERQRFERVSNEQRLLTEALHDTATAINNSLELKNVFTTILTHVARVVPHDYADITLIEDGFSYVVHVDGDAPEGIENLRFPIDETPILRTIYETRSPLLIPNISEYPGWKQVLNSHTPQSYVGAPISLEGNVIGFINLINEHEPFPPHYAERLRVFAVQVGRAIYNARIHEQVRNYATHLEEAVAQRTNELARERAQLRATLDSMGEGVSVVMFDENNNQEISYINPALYQILQYTPEQLQDHHDNNTLAPWEQMLLEGSNTLQDQPIWQGETTITRPDGTSIEVAIITSRIDNEAGEIIGYVGIFRDISQEKTLQQRQARFVAQASHELRTPISNFKQRIFLIRRQPERMDEHLRVLDQTSDHIAYLVNDMMDLTRFQNGLMRFDMRIIHLQTLLRDVIEMHRPAMEEKQITLHTAITNQPLRVNADSTRLIQVLTNLISNAINYSAQHSTVRVSMEATANEVILTVQDNGSGIRPEALTHIFQPFYRANSFISGTGLGLSIAKEIIDAHGGDISVESTLDVGSTFTIRLPAAKE
jgi:PAS domain S-box-containing protein